MKKWEYRWKVRFLGDEGTVIEIPAPVSYNLQESVDYAWKSLDNMQLDQVRAAELFDVIRIDKEYGTEV